MRFAALLLLAACNPGPPPALTVAQAVEMPVVGQSPLIIGRDGGWGGRVFGHEIFTFGDSVVTVPDAQNGVTFHSNSYSFTDDFDASDGIRGLTENLDSAGSPLPIIPATDDEETFWVTHHGDPTCPVSPCGARWATWPGALTEDPANNRVLVSYGLIYIASGGPNVPGGGASFAVWSDFTQTQATRPLLGYCPDHPTLLFCDGEGDWTGTVLAEGDTLYAFNCENTGFSSNCKLAQVPLAAALDKSQWQVWDGAAWGSDFSRAKILFEGGLNMRFYFSQYAQTYVAIYSKNLSKTVAYRTAPSLTGPWSREEKLFEAHNDMPDATVYDAYVQPDYARNGGQIIYVTCSRGTTGWFGSELAMFEVTFQ
jgi:hypothetical protein